METKLNVQKESLSNVESLILGSYPNLTITDLNLLIKVTGSVSGVSFISVKGYKSDKSNNTEIANHIINVGASYENMLKKDSLTFDNVNLNDIDVSKFNYSSIIFDCSLTDFQTSVKENLQIALDELKQPKKLVI